MSPATHARVPNPSIRVLGKNMLLKADLRDVAQQLVAHQIDFFVIKGLPLTYEVFGDLSRRAMLDNDVVVRRRDVRQAYSVLKALGFIDAHDGTLDRSLAGNFQHSMYREHCQGIRTTLELHWCAFPPHLFRVSEEWLFTQLRRFDLPDAPVWVMVRPLVLLHLASHFVQHQLNKPSILRDLGLAWDLFAAELEPTELHQTARTTGTEHALAYALQAAQALGFLHNPVPREFQSVVAHRVARLLPFRQLRTAVPRSASRYLLSWMLAGEGQFMRNVCGELLPSPGRMRLIQGDIGDGALALSYLRRPLGYLLSSFSFHAGAKTERRL